MNQNDIDEATLNALTVTQLYEHEMALRFVLFNSGVINEPDRDHIIADGFASISEIVSHHPNDPEGFATYLKNMNKTFASSNNADLRRYYSPITISRLTGVIHYFDQCVNNLHMVPDVSFIDRATTDNLSVNYKHFKDKSKKRLRTKQVMTQSLFQN